MKRLLTWLLSQRRWAVLAVCSVPLMIWAGWALSFKTIATVAFVVIWFAHMALGIGAGYAALRLWHSRHHPLIKWLGLYINAFIIDVVSAIVLLFVARGVKFTWKFTAVMFISTLLSDIVRAPLIFYLIKGPTKAPLQMPNTPETSGAMPPGYWAAMFQEIRNEIAGLRDEVAKLKQINS